MFTRQYIAVIHSVPTALPGGGYTSTLKLSLLDPISRQNNPGVRTDHLVHRLEGQPDTFLDVAIACPTAPTFLGSTQFRRGKAVQQKFQQKYRKYATAVRAQPGVADFQPQFVQLDRKTFGFTQTQSSPLGWIASANTLRSCEISCSGGSLGYYGGYR